MYCSCICVCAGVRVRQNDFKRLLNLPATFFTSSFLCVVFHFFHLTVHPFTGHVARAVAQFRGHKELAAAAEHALAVEDLEATMPEEVMD